jgi:tetratricopeptide (TPR) repeat protein
MRRVCLPVCLLIALAAASRDAAAQPRVVRPAVRNSQHEELKTQADAAYRKGDYAQAIDTAGQVIAANPSDHVAYYLRASARVELGIQKQDAQTIRDGIADAREAIRIEGRNNVDYYLPYMYGMSHLAGLEQKPAHAESARDVATQLLALNRPTGEQKANLAYQRALIHLQLGNRAEALTDFGNAINYNPRHTAARLAKCDLLVQGGKLDDAEAAWRETVAALPDQPLVFNNRGMFFQSLGRHDEALADFDRAIQLEPQFAAAYANRGFTRIETGRPTEALLDLDQAIELDPAHIVAFSLRGTARLELGDAAAAVNDYQAAVRLNPDNPALHADVGFSEFFARHYDEATAAFRAAIERDPQARFLDPWRVAALLLADKRPQAEADFADVLQKDPADRLWSDALVLLLLGKVTDSDVLGAISSGDAAAAENQKCEAFYFIGLRWELDGKKSDAEPYFRQALATKAPHLSAYRGARFAVNEFATGSGAQ